MFILNNKNRCYYTYNVMTYIWRQTSIVTHFDIKSIYFTFRSVSWLRTVAYLAYSTRFLSSLTAVSESCLSGGLPISVSWLYPGDKFLLRPSWSSLFFPHGRYYSVSLASILDRCWHTSAGVQLPWCMSCIRSLLCKCPYFFGAWYLVRRVLFGAIAFAVSCTNKTILAVASFLFKGVLLM